jgi:hypothetical protein
MYLLATMLSRWARILLLIVATGHHVYDPCHCYSESCGEVIEE